MFCYELWKKARKKQTTQTTSRDVIWIVLLLLAGGWKWLVDGHWQCFSFSVSDVSHSIHFEAIMRVTEWQNKVVRCTAKSAIKQALSLGGATKAERAASGKGDDETAVATSKKFGADGKRKYKKYKTHGLVSSKIQ
jgi:hypothetical protein